MRLGLSVLCGAVAGLLALAPVAASAQEMTAGEKELYEAAQKEGELTWYTAHTSAEVAEAIGSAFTERYPGVRVNVVRSTAQVAFQRLSQDLRAGVAQCDVFSSTDLGHYQWLKSENLLMQYRPENAEGVVDAFKNLDPDNYFHTTSAGLVLITYNKNLVSEEEKPKKWTDLIDPKWKDQVTVGHPGFSGYVGTWVVMLRKLYGWEFFEKLEQNNPQIGRSINDTVTMLNAGERKIGAGPSGTTLISASRGNPVGLIYPEDGTLLMIAPSGILANSKNPNAAKLFLNFLLGPDAGRVAVSYFGESLRPDVEPAPGAMPLDQIKLIRPSTEEIEQGIPEVKELWRDTFGV
ncbi:MAG: ABC transporter substrate-binding protein [Alphaproteobacteria bacterium]